ncbi:hypothetical protein, partial [Listeria booriae]
ADTSIDYFKRIFGLVDIAVPEKEQAETRSKA